MFGLVVPAVMLALTFLYFNDVGLPKVLAFWGGYILTWFLPLLGLPSTIASFIGLGVAAGFYITAKTA